MTENLPYLQAVRLRAFGGTLLAAALFSSAAAMIAAWRASAGSLAFFFRAWGVATALTLPVVLVGGVLLRGALRGLPRSTGSEGEHEGELRPRLVATCAWVIAMAIVLQKLGAILRSQTHHHALAGATFALVSLSLGLGFALASARLRAFVTRRSRRLLAVTIALVLAALYAIHSLRAGLALADDASRACVIDAAAILAGALCAAWCPSPRKWAMALGTSSIGLVVIGALGCAAPAVDGALGRASPLFEVLARLFRG